MKRSRALALAAGGLTVAFARPAAAQPVPLKIAAVPIDASAEPFYANDAGFFNRAGIEATFMGGDTGPAIAAGVAAGATDVGVSNTVSLVQARARGLPFVIIAPGSIYDAKFPSYLIVVPKGSSIRSARDLTGKTIGVSVLNGIPHYAARAWIDAGGGDSPATKFIEIPHPEMLAALAQGRVDAASLTEPYLTPARVLNRSIGAPFDAIASRYLVSAHFTTLDWARGHPDLVRRYVRAIAGTAQWANGHPDLIVPMLVKYSKQPDDAVRAMQRSEWSVRLDSRELQPVIDVTAKYGNVARFAAEEMLYRVP